MIDIIAMCKSPRMLNLELSDGQESLLRTTYGLALTPEQDAIRSAATGVCEYVRRVYRDIATLNGRQSGKTSRFIVPFATYESCIAEHEIPANERGVFLICAPTEAQAARTASMIADSIRQSIFSRLVESIRETASDFVVRLSNRRDIVVSAANQATLRGPLYFGVALEEAAFFRDSVSSTYNLDQILEALRPGLLTLQSSKLVRVSSPWVKSGPMWNDYANRATRPEMLCWKAPSCEMNPKLSARDLERERQRDEVYFNREFGCEFVDSAEQLLPTELVEAAVDHGVYEFAPQPGMLYVTSLDPSSRGDDFAMVVSHAEGAVVTVDYVRAWRAPGRGKFIDYNRVIPEIVTTMRRYGSPKAYSDQIAAAALSAMLEREGLGFEQSGTYGLKGAPKFLTARQKFVAREVRLPEQPELIEQLKRLEEVRAQGGRVAVEARTGKDDLAVAACAAIAYAVEAGPSEPWCEYVSAGPLRNSFSRGREISTAGWSDDGPSWWWHRVD